MRTIIIALLIVLTFIVEMALMVVSLTVYGILVNIANGGFITSDLIKKL